MSESHTPPAAVRRNARRGLELRRKWKRGGFSTGQAASHGVGSGVQRASDLAGGGAVSMDTVWRMHGFFSRHRQNYDPGKREADGGPTAGTIAWLLWGGSAGASWASGIVSRAEKSFDIEVLKSTEHGLILGYAVVCQKNGEDYYDLHNDHIPEDAMLEAALEAARDGVVMKVQHRGKDAGSIPFMFPVTADIAKALGLSVERTGLIVGVLPEDPAVMKEVRAGRLTGFSIGGRRVIDEEVT